MITKLAAVVLYFLAAYVQAAGTDTTSIKNAAHRYFPMATWRERPIISADFTCSGRKEWAVLGTTPSEILVAIFVKGQSEKPEILHYSRSVRNASTAVLAPEDMDYDPQEDPFYALPVFERSKTCKELNLSDGEVDSAHIYWNHKARRFDAWTR